LNEERTGKCLIQEIFVYKLPIEEMQEVYASGLTHEESTRRLIAKLVYKPAKAFNIFLQSLRKGNDCYKEIVED
jgi:phage terminase large subunit-like protein